MMFGEAEKKLFKSGKYHVISGLGTPSARTFKSNLEYSLTDIFSMHLVNKGASTRKLLI
jgi:hypothetical protein